MSTLVALLTPDALLQRAGPATFERGRRYFQEYRVCEIAVAGGEATARVAGSELYRVRLWDDGGRLGFDCSCPVGIELSFCKHCVALAMALNPSADAAAPADARDEVRAFLERHSRDELVEMVMEFASEDPRLRGKLDLRVAAARKEGVDLASFRAALDEAFEVDDFVDYYHASGFADNIYGVLAELSSLVQTAPAAAIELLEDAAERAETAIESVDDSGGEFTGIFEEIATLHLAACQNARPDPVDLAERLFEFELRADYDIFFNIPERYADVLGEAGLAAYRAHAEKEWSRVPALAPGVSNTYVRRHQITGMMTSLARATGGVDAIADVLRRDLSTAYSFLRIAEAYRDAGEYQRGLEWAEAGLVAFPERADYRLRDFIIEEHQRAGRHDQAMRLAWNAFTEGAELSAFQSLHARATRANAWPEWRERAVAFLRQRATDPSTPPHDHTTLARIFLWEGRADEAWNEALRGGCSEDLWFELARAREVEHPADAIPIYQRRIAGSVALVSERGYEDAVRLLRRLRGVFERAGHDDAEFARYVAELREEHKRKRNFIKLLDAAAASLGTAATPSEPR